MQVQFSGYKQQCLFKGRPFIAKVYDGSAPIVDGFNTVCIRLDASLSSLLQWDEAIDQAECAIKKGMLILWELDFNLGHNLDDEALFLTLQLNVYHFNETLWKRFHEHTFGVALFRGELTDELLCCLQSLAALLNMDASCFLFLDASEIVNLRAFLHLISRPKLGCFIPFIKGPLAKRYAYASGFFAWGQGSSPLGYCSDKLEQCQSSQLIPEAFCLTEGLTAEEIMSAIERLEARPFRFIEEQELHLEWEGIEKLYVFSRTLNVKLKRKIAGFEASGGEAIIL